MCGRYCITTPVEALRRHFDFGGPGLNLRPRWNAAPAGGAGGPQYSGTAGRIENCQIGVFLAYAHGRALIDRALYLAESWTKDRFRCRAAGIPKGVVFTTKPKLGQPMLARAFAAGVPCAWVVGDSVYGADDALRRLIEAHGRGYVLAVTSAQRLGLKPVQD